MSKITGKVVIRIDGAVLPAENQATLTPGGVNRTPEVHGGNTYYTEEDQPPMLECNVLMTKDIDVIALNKITTATVLFEADTGQKYMMRNAFTTEVIPHDGSGKAAMKMSAQAVDKV